MLEMAQYKQKTYLATVVADKESATSCIKTETDTSI